MQLTVLSIVLPWFAVMGGYVSGLRRRLSEANQELRQAIGHIEEIAIRDALTGAYNRGHLFEVLRHECARSNRNGGPLSICMFDLDHFKQINDRFGHPAGDAVLKRFGDIAKAALRAADVLGRYGGEEFLAVLPDTGAPGAIVVAERIRLAVESAALPEIPAHRVTVSVGVATRRSTETVEAFLARADQALYRAKEAGRNRVMPDISSVSR